MTQRESRPSMNSTPSPQANIKDAVTPRVIVSGGDNEREVDVHTLDPLQHLGCDFLSLVLPTKIGGENSPISNNLVYRIFDPSRLLSISEMPKH